MTKPWWTRALLGRTSVSNPLQDDEARDPQFETQWRPLIKKRLIVIFAFLGFWVVSLEGRLVWIQVVNHQEWADRARVQQEKTEPIEAPRGEIRDRRGRLVAFSLPSFDLYANPNNIRDKEDGAKVKNDTSVFAAQLCKALGDCDAAEQASIAAKLDKPKASVLIRRARQMPAEAIEGVRAFAKDLGKWQNLVTLLPSEARFYPNMELMAQVVGFLDEKGVGASGVERQFDQLLRGTPGQELVQRDGNQKIILTTTIVPPKPGISIELTIDLALQEILSRELQKGIDDAGALGGAGLILDSATGEVLAMSSLPTYNPNLPGKSNPQEQRNRVVQDLYEPGSTFKIVTLAAALNEGVVNSTTLFDTNPGRLSVEGRSKAITEDKGHNYKVLDVQGILVKSSNVGAAMVGLRLGPDHMLHYAKAFGFGKPETKQEMARDFFSERIGRITVPPGGLTRGALATVSFGYQVTANPLQIASAMNVFANGGLMMRPRLIHATIEGDVRRVNAPEVLARVVTPETAATMTTMLEGVVEDGTGDRAALPRYRVAGKTGTAKQVRDGGGYSETDYLVSFVGFAPSRHPRFTVIIVVEKPTKLPAYGGAVSAPVFKRVTEAALHYVGELPSVNAAPAVVVSDERPKAPRPRPIDPQPVLANTGDKTLMPDLTGMTLRDARRLLPAGLTLTSTGDGIVVSQSPAAGEPMTNRAVLKLQREPVKTGGSGR